MRLIYRWSGEYFGFLSNAGDLFDAAGRYLGWVAANGMVRDAEGAYLGQLLEGGYVIRELNGTTPMRLVPRAPQSSPSPPEPGAPRSPRLKRPTHIDSLDAFPPTSFDHGGVCRPSGGDT
ncbi:MAG TPA: hypothetical protein VKE74_30670 [Gemmataceae bacterium]|nr:hypothetical protein [Gemmataceae bacterium]